MVQPPYVPGDMVTIEVVDTEGLWGRELHPPVTRDGGRPYSPINGDTAVILKPIQVMGGYDDDGNGNRLSNEWWEFDEDGDMVAGGNVADSELGSNIDEAVGLTWIFLAMMISGEHKGQQFELADYEISKGLAYIGLNT